MRNLNLLKKVIFYIILFSLILHLAFLSLVLFIESGFSGGGTTVNTQCLILKKDIYQSGFGAPSGSHKIQDLYSVYYTVAYTVNNSEYTSKVAYVNVSQQKARAILNEYDINKTYRCNYNTSNLSNIVLGLYFSAWTQFLFELGILFILVFINYYTDWFYHKKMSIRICL